jgi:hypothetical protein
VKCQERERASGGGGSDTVAQLETGAIAIAKQQKWKRYSLRKEESQAVEKTMEAEAMQSQEKGEQAAEAEAEQLQKEEQQVVEKKAGDHTNIAALTFIEPIHKRRNESGSNIAEEVQSQEKEEQVPEAEAVQSHEEEAQTACRGGSEIDAETGTKSSREEIRSGSDTTEVEAIQRKCVSGAAT